MWTLSGFADEIADNFTDQLALITELGLTQIDLRSAWGTNVLDLDDAQLTEVGRLLDDAGVAVGCIGSPIGKVDIAADAIEHFSRFEHCLDVADRFGCTRVRLFSFFMPAAEAPVHRDEVVSRLGVMARRAEERGIVLLHENEKDIFGDVPQRCVDLLAGVDSPALRAIWDPANFVQVGVQRPFDALASLRPWLDYLHIKDAQPDGSVVPAGEGAGQLRETLRSLADDGWDGVLSLEPHLAEVGAFGGFSGPERWRRAHGALTSLLDAEGIEYR